MDVNGRNNQMVQNSTNLIKSEITGYIDNQLEATIFFPPLTYRELNN
jgi:hypothetical protein